MTRLPLLGVDVAKATLACCLLDETGHRHRWTSPNTLDAFAGLWQRVHQVTTAPVHVVMEATGGYEEALATYCADQGATVYVVNPLRIKRWSESELRRSKTDALDAASIAAFGTQAEKLTPWRPVAPAFRALQQLVRLRQALVEARQAHANRLQAPGVLPATRRLLEAYVADAERHLAELDAVIMAHIQADPDLQRLHAHLDSIPGIGPQTAQAVLAEIGDGHQFQTSNQLTAFAGLDVRQYDSGTSVHKRPHLSKRGSARLRSALYFPALSARQHHPHLKAVADRLAAAGKPKKAIIGVVMRKLLVEMHALLRDDRPHDATHRHPREPQLLTTA